MTNVDDIEVWWKRIGCVRNPGTHTGEEAARDAEIKELRAALAERMSHLELLKKYMQVVMFHENYDYATNADAKFAGLEWTEEENEELGRISKELGYEY